MKINLRVTLFLLLASTELIAQDNINEASQFIVIQSDRPQDPQADYMNFVPNEVLVKFRDEVDIKSGIRLKSSGVSAIDNILHKHDIAELQRVFPGAVKSKSPRIIRDPQGRDMVIPNLDNIFRLNVPANRSSQTGIPEIFTVIEELKALPEVEYAEPNYILSIGDFEAAGPELTADEIMLMPDQDDATGTVTGFVPNDPLFNQQWGIPACNIDEVWNTHTGDTTSIIAILDTGVDWLHPDLAPNIWQNPDEIPGNGIDDDGNGKIDDIRGWDFINNDNNPTDDNSHGTHCAGIAAAVGNNGIGIAGVNWNARIMPIKVFQSSGYGDAATIAAGVNYAAIKGATVLSMSFGSYAESLTLKNALANAYAIAVLVAAAGNDGLCIGPGICPDKRIGRPVFPGSFSFVLGVETNAQFSNYDQDGPVFSLYPELNNYELCGPGVEILSCVPGGNYRKYSGTSMAAPLVASAVSLYRELRTEESHEILSGNFINSLNLHIDLDAALNIIPIPILDIVSYQVTDTIDGDNDGRPDVGETIEFKIKVRNTWGQADDVKVGIEFGEFEDPTTATIITQEASIGSVSAYATNENAISLKIKLSENIIDGRDIVFNLKTWYGDHLGEKDQPITINIENGLELGGIISQDLTLYSNKQYIITENLAIPHGVTLTIMPGTVLKFSNNLGMIIAGNLIAVGNKDSMITFTKRTLNTGWGGIQIEGNGNFIAGYNIIEYITNSPSGRIFVNMSNNFELANSIIQKCSGYNGLYAAAGTINKSNFLYNTYYYLGFWGSSNVNNIINNLCSTIPSFMQGTLVPMAGFSQIYNNVFSNLSINGLESNIINYVYDYFDVVKLDSNYYGSLNEQKINQGIIDYPELGRGAWFDISNKMIRPSKNAHGIVWKILVNGIDAQDEFDQLDPLGFGLQKYEVYFNRAMDTLVVPLVSIGVRFPFTQSAIAEYGIWSADSTIYTVYGTVDLNTGDGINTIRVIGAQDTDHFEIPIEDRRFRVIVNAAGSASVGFQATPGLGKVELEWNDADLADGLGYNMYRKTRINDSTLSQPVLINSQLITDTLYVDFDVIPGDQYYYYYKILRTNLSETDSSRIVGAIPLTASIGDANGDLTVNVLDITTIVAYLLNNDPQPFIYDAADVNADDNINVLDIVGLVNLVMGNTKSVNITNEMAFLYIENDTLFADMPVAIGGIQVEFGGIGIEDITILKALKGFESGHCMIDNKLRLLFYSMTGKSLAAGKRVPLLKIGKPAWIENPILADTKGGAVNIGQNRLYTAITSDIAKLGQNYPNPFTGETVIPFIIYQQVDEAVLRIYNIYGQLVAFKVMNKPEVGENLFKFSSIKNKGLLTYVLEVKSEGQIVRFNGMKMVNH